MIALTQAAIVEKDINGMIVWMSMQTRPPYMGIKYVRAVTSTDTHAHTHTLKSYSPLFCVSVSWIFLSYAAIQAFCLINNLSVMYRTPTLIWLSVKCAWRWPPAPSFSLSLVLCLQNQQWHSTLSLPCRCVIVLAVWHACSCVHLCVCVCRVEDGGAILKGLQLHLNGIIGHDGWLLPFHGV